MRLNLSVLPHIESEVDKGQNSDRNALGGSVFCYGSMAWSIFLLGALGVQILR